MPNPELSFVSYDPTPADGEQHTLSNSLCCSVPFEYPDEALPPELEQIIQEKADRLSMDRLRALLSTLMLDVLPAKSPRVVLASYAYAFQLPLISTVFGDDTLAAMAKALGVSRQNLQQQVEQITTKYGIEKLRDGVDAEAKAKYKEANKRNYTKD